VSFADPLLRAILTGAYQLMKAGWFLRRPRVYGAHAFALTPERKLILVKLRYARGWRPPGGGRHANESPADAALRELREEIGMISHGRVRLACELERTVSFRHDLQSLLIVEDVRYSAPRWSWEVERIMEAPLDELPRDMSPIARLWFEAVGDLL
jgi:8-oxo-dGTP pyrophosphatase MutT (NUDIX family)